MLKVMENGAEREAGDWLFELDEIARTDGSAADADGALEAEADEYVARHREQRDETGRALVVHNGRAQSRKLTLGAGTVELKAPRVNDRRRDEQGQRQRFTSRILPPYMRRSPKVAEVLPVLYLRGLSTGDFRPVLEGLLGEEAAGLSPTNIARLTACWEKEYTAFGQRDLSGREYVYVWVDGVHFNIRLEDDRLCALVMIGARPNGQKELLAVEDGYRESAESWKTLLRELKRRGMAAPVMAVGDGALGFWAAARAVWPETREQACWCHKLVNVLDKLPQRLQPRAKRALHEMMYAERRADCAAARSRFEAEYQAKYPKAVESLTAHWERLVTFFDFPAEHWKHLRTTNVIVSPFATVRLRERATRGAGSRTKGLLMAFKLLEMAQLRGRRLDGAQLLPLVGAGLKFADGVQLDPAKHVTQSTDNQPREAA
ncbi:MAG: IS256 family transposase [Candidatus Binataceae bacterium]